MPSSATTSSPFVQSWLDEFASGFNGGNNLKQFAMMGQEKHVPLDFSGRSDHGASGAKAQKGTEL